MKDRLIWIVTFVLAMATFSCESPLVGLGSKVDMEAPRSVSVTPKSGSYASGLMTMTGTVEDASTIKTVKVRVLDKATDAVLASYEATIVDKTWSLPIDTRLFLDGQYNIALTIIDAAGNPTEDRVLVGFDNRSPTVLIENPLDLSIAYNGEVHISGQAYDANSSVAKVNVSVYKSGSVTPLFSGDSTTLPKWDVIFNASDAAYALTLEDLTFVVTAYDEGGNTNKYQYEYKSLYTANANKQLTASQIDLLDSQLNDNDTIDGLSFNKATLTANRKDTYAETAGTASVLKVDVDSDKPTFVFVTPGDTNISEATTYTCAGGTKANGTIKDDDLNVNPFLVTYRYALTSANLTLASWNNATVTGTGYEARWEFIMPGTNGNYQLQIKGVDNGGAIGISGTRYFTIDDGKPLVTIDTSNPSPWKLYYGKDQSILVNGTANRPDGFITQVQIQVGSNPWTDINGISGLGSNESVSWANYNLSLSGLSGGSTQVRVRALDNKGIWGQTEVLIIMDVDVPLISFTNLDTNPDVYIGTDINGTVVFRGDCSDGALDTFITVLDKVEAKVDTNAYAKITGTYSWSTSINTQSLSDGLHTLWIKAYDTAGNIKEESIAFTVLQSSDKPTVSVNNLIANATVGGSFIVSGVAGDDDGISSEVSAVQIKIEKEDAVISGVWTTYQDWSNISDKSGSETILSWTYALPNLPSANYRLSIRTRDKNSVALDFGSSSAPAVNYWNYTSTIAFIVDNDVPVVNQADFTPAIGSYVKDTFTLNGTITEDKSLSKVEVFINNVTKGTATVSGTAPNFTFSFTVDKSWLSSSGGGANSIRVEATDNSSPKKTGSGTIQIIYDQTAPESLYLTPDESSTVNGSLVISGTASDNNQVAELWYSVKPVGSNPTYPTDYTRLTNQKYSFSYTLLTTGLTDKTDYKFYMVVVDGAGNPSLIPSVLNFRVDQDSDRPIIKLSNIDPDGVPSVTIIKMSNTVFGSVSDDDGTITKFEVSENGTDWNDIILSGGSFSYNSSAGDSAKTLYFRVTDKTNKVFATNSALSANKPRIENGSVGTYIETSVVYKIDTNFPDVNSIVSVDYASPFDFVESEELKVSMPLGGSSSGIFKLRALATDASGIKALTVTVPGASGSPFTAVQNGVQLLSGTNYNRYDTGNIAVTGITPDGALTITIETEDNSGLKTTITRTIKVDNTIPEYTITTPFNGEVVNGDILVKGTALDKESGLKSVEYKLGYNADSESWTAFTNMYSWEIDLTGANKSDLYAGKLLTSDSSNNTFTCNNHGFANNSKIYFSASTLPGSILSTESYYVSIVDINTFKISLTSGGSVLDFTSNGVAVYASSESKDLNNDQIWDFPIQIRVTDNAGNTNTTVLGDYVIQLDPGGDKPRVTVSYPDAPGRTLAGAIRVYGIATDDDAVDKVYMQIDANSDGFFTADDDNYNAGGIDWYNSGSGIEVNGSANWYKIINDDGKLNPISGTKTILIRLRAKDIYGLYGNWSSAQSIIIDKGVPQFTAIKIDSDAVVNGNEQDYSVGMYVSGTTVYLRGAVVDDGGITDILLSGAVTGSLSLNPTWFTLAYAGKGYDMAIPITLPAGTSASKQFIVTAYDNSGTPRDSAYEIRFNYDNQKPTISLNAIASPTVVAQSNGWYKVKGTAEDTGSDVDRVEVYFIRRGNGGTTFDRIYNPADQNTSTLLSTIDFTNNYPTIKGIADSRTVATLTHSTLINNKMIAPGQKIYIGTNLRTISDFDSASGIITWTGGNVVESETSYTIRIAIQIDRKDIIESSKSFSGVVTRIAGDEKSFTDASLISNPDNTVISVGDTVKVNGEYRIISTWNKTTGKVTWSGADVPVATNQAYEIFSVAGDDADHYVEYLKQDSGITYTWSVDIKCDAIPDGPIEIHYIVFDNAGNFVHSSNLEQNFGDYKIQNNGPRMAGVILGSDLDASGTVSEGEKSFVFAFNSATAASETKAFNYIIKDGPVYIEPVITNGNGDLKMWMTGAKTINNYALRTGGVIAPINGSTIADSDLGAMGDGSQTFTMKIWDSTEETNANVDSLNITRGITVSVDYVDSVAPTAAIRPFYWNSSASNSLYNNSSVNGHIEISGVYDDVDSDVSGQISFRGTAYDDQRISAIYAYLDGFTFTGATTTKTIGSDTYALLGTYSAGTWTANDQWTNNHWSSAITDYGIGQDGHRIGWQLNIDTAYITDVAAINRNLKIVVEDRATSPSPATVTAATLTGTATERPSVMALKVTANSLIKAGQLIVLGTGEQAYANRISSYNAGSIVLAESIDTTITGYTIYLDSHQSPSCSVDVVPYIYSITDPTGLSSDVLRGSTGKYSLSAHASNTLSIKGFNLGKADATIVTPVAQISNAPISSASGYDVTETLVSSTDMTIRKDLAKSGYLTLFVSTIPSINNLSTANSKDYQKESQTGKPNSAMWTDDRYLWVWANTPISLSGVTGSAQITSANVGNLTFYNPNMVMKGEQPEFSFNDENFGQTIYTDSDTTAIRRTGYRLTRPAGMAATTINGIWQRFIATTYDSQYGTGWDNSGFLEITGFADQTLDTMTNSLAPSSNGSGSGGNGNWSTIQGVDYFAENDNSNSGTYRKANRYNFPKIIVETSTNNTLAANLFMTYFDSSTYQESLNFVSFQKTGASAAFDNIQNATGGNRRSPHVVTIPGTNNASSKYYDMIKVGNGIAVVYYDPVSKSLKLASSSNPFQVRTDSMENITTVGGEMLALSLTNTTVGNYAGKYFTIYSGTTAYDVWFDTTGVATKPGAATSSNEIKVDFSPATITARLANIDPALTTAVPVTGNDKLFTSLTIAAIRANPAFSNTAIQYSMQDNANKALSSACATQVIRVNATGDSTDASMGNLATATAVGTVSVISQGTVAPDWSTITVDSGAISGDTSDVGMFVSMAADGGKLYVSYYDFDNANLKFARISWSGTGTPTIDSRVAIDSYLSAGTWTKTIMIENSNLTGQSSKQPVIAYYADSYNGTKKPIRMAFPKFDATSGTLKTGAKADDSYTGDWEVITLQALSVPKGGADTFNRVQAGVYASGSLPVLGWLGDKLEYSKLQPNN